MARNERTSKAVASLASKALRTPDKLTNSEIKKLAASALTQAPDKSATKKKTAKKAAKKTAKKTTKKTTAKKKPARKTSRR